MSGYKGIGKSDGEEEAEDPMAASQTRLLVDDEAGGPALSMSGDPHPPEGQLSVPETAILSLEFCMLWFLANYLVAACLEYTSVASSTILTSTSSIWTLIFGVLFRVEGFSYKKLMGVMASLAGIVLISSVDLSGKDNDENRGNFPHKSQAEIAIGDAMAFGSAIMYGVYAIVMKKRIGNEDRVNMPLFFGMVGLFNVVFLWPGFIILHFTGVERFALPPTGKIWTIVLVSQMFISLKKGSLIVSLPAQLSVLLRFRLLLGIRNALDNPVSCDSRVVDDDSTLPHWTDDFEFSVLKCSVLGWRVRGLVVFSVYQP